MEQELKQIYKLVCAVSNYVNFYVKTNMLNEQIEAVRAIMSVEVKY